MSTITTGQIRIIKTFHGKMEKETAKMMVRGFTGMRTEHVSDMTFAEATSMIIDLKKNDPNEKSAELMRRKLIALAYKRAGLSSRANAAQKKAVVVWLDEWCKKYGCIKKSFNNYTYKELPQLVSQFEIVMDKLVVEI